MPKQKLDAPEITTLAERRWKGDSLTPSEWRRLEASGWEPEPGDVDAARKRWSQGPPFSPEDVRLLLKGTPLRPLRADDTEQQMLEFERRIRRIRPEPDPLDLLADSEAERVFREKIFAAEQAEEQARQRYREAADRYRRARTRLRELEGQVMTIITPDAVRTETVKPRTGSAAEIVLARGEVEDAKRDYDAAEADLQRALVALNALRFERDRYKVAVKVAATAKA